MRATVNPDTSPDRASDTARFADYLEAKLALDDRSLNRDVGQAFLETLRPKSGVLRWLDVGTGTGAMVRRLLKTGLAGALEITALDRDPRLLELASTRIAEELARLKYEVRGAGSAIEAYKPGTEVRVEFRRSGVLEFAPKPERYDVVTAHAFMDIVPVAAAVSRFSDWLTDGGVFYATLNYDGSTALFPSHDDESFEHALLAKYDVSMEERRVAGAATGAARSGRRLHARLCGSDFEMLAYGGSDWNITPRRGVYRDRDAEVLHVLLAVIRDESERNPAIDRGKLERWHASRVAQLQRGELGMIVHHVDIAAVRRQALTAFT